ncbi:MAG: tetratricopeptide repeat protein [Candidatus Omnitrophota bacterium]
MHKIKIIILLLISIFISGNVLFAETPEEIFEKANRAYQDQDYKNAASIYGRLVDTGKVNAEVYYNLGNTYFKLEEIGKAILNYERATRISPRDRDIKLNLKLARTRQVDRLDLPDRGFIINSVLYLYDRMNINELTFFNSIVYLIIMVLLIFSIKLVEKRKFIFYTILSLGALLSFSLTFLFSKIAAEHFTKEAVIISEEVDVRSGPNEDYLKQFTLHEGTKLRIIKEIKNWYEIDLSKDLRGWLPKESVEII